MALLLEETRIVQSHLRSYYLSIEAFCVGLAHLELCYVKWSRSQVMLFGIALGDGFVRLGRLPYILVEEEIDVELPAFDVLVQL